VTKSGVKGRRIWQVNVEVPASTSRFFVIEDLPHERCILTVFGLQGLGFFLRGWHLTEGAINLKLRDESADLCPRCQQQGQDLYERGPWRKIYHGFGFGLRVYLLVRKDRYFCLVCQRVSARWSRLFSPGRGEPRRQNARSSGDSESGAFGAWRRRKGLRKCVST